MDEVNEFFDLSRPKQRIILRGPQTNGVQVVDEDFISNLSERRYEGPSTKPNLGSDYATEYQERERTIYMERKPTIDEHDGGIDSLENLTSIGDMSLVADLTEETLTQVYNKYTFHKDVNPNLSINEVKKKILATISAQNVTIIEGPTGCGKTTQVPQWILDDSYEKRKHCNIIVTQPRRIAAISISKRVCQERGWDLGGLVGYQVGLENKTTNDTRLRYVTTGVLLQKLVAAQNMNEYSHIILDEIHERGQDMDFLLLIVRKFLYTNSRSVKVILMSATFNIKDFAQYFAASTPTGYEMSPVISVQKKSPFVVKDFYLNQLDKLGAMPHIKFEDPIISEESYNIVVKLIHAFENIDKNERHVDESQDETDYTRPTVLVFLPGINEIEELHKKLTYTKSRQEIVPESGQYNWTVLPLHSTITSDEQANVFHKAPPGFRKIILSTNIAESSITVPDIKYIIDFCLMKVLVADPYTNFTSLQLCWASKSNCKQRAGRTGRVCDGRVYRLVPDHFYEMLPEDCPPEIKRCPLDRLVLLSKMLKMGTPKSILALAMDPPDLSNIQRTVLTLKEVGGLLKTCNGELTPEDGDITYLGVIMAKLPVDVRISKLIVLGYIYGCLNECIIMGSAMSVKSIFSSPFQERLKAYNTKLTWADGSTSDCLAALNVYQVWHNLRQQQHFKTTRGGERGWAKEAYVQLRALNEMDDLVREMRRRLAREGIEDTMGNMKSSWNRAEKPFILKLLIAGAFYPHYFVQPKNTDDYERDAVKILAGCDPCNTIYLKTEGISNQPLELYTKSLKHSLYDVSDETRVTFDKNSSKIFVSFISCHRQRDQRQQDAIMPGIPGKVVLPVYKAVKMRQLKLPISINVLPQDKAEAAFAALSAKDKEEINYLSARLPDIDDTYIDVVISHIINCGNFWVQHADVSSREELMKVNTGINNQNLTSVSAKKAVQVGELYAAPYEDESTATRYYRAVIKLLLPQDMVWVFYIDYGNYARVRKSTLREIPKNALRDISPLAFECMLSEIAPSVLKDTRGIWSNEANMKFQQLTANKRLIAKVYSVAYGVVSVELLVENQLNVNEYLIQQGLAQCAEEGYQSKLNHDIRESAKTLQMVQIRALNKEQALTSVPNHFEVHSPNPKDCCQRITLKGPFSPLEVSVFNLMLGSKDKTVGIEWNSVNSVLLDTNPQDPYERLLVSACVGQNQSGDRLTLRHTTLMPNIPGLLTIVSLIFCPTMEMRRDSTKTRYTSTLCGLGHDGNGRALFPEHDMLINVDVDLKNEDLEYINHLRHLMNIMLFRQDGQDEPLIDEKLKAMIPSKIREIITKLMLRQRKHREIIPVAQAWKWNSVPVTDIQEPDMPDTMQSSVFPLHSALTLYPVNQDEIKKLAAENQKLYEAVSRNSAISSKRELECTLCGTAPLPLHSLRIHLFSRMHKEKEADLSITNKSTSYE